MTNEMRLLLQSLIKSAQAQMRQLDLQIEDYDAMLETVSVEDAVEDAVKRGLDDYSRAEDAIERGLDDLDSVEDAIERGLDERHQDRFGI